MRCGICLATLLVLLAGAAVAADAKKDADKDDKKPEADKLVNLGQIAGVLTSTGGSETEFTIRVTLYTIEPNTQAQADWAKKQQDLVKRQVDIMKNRDPVQRQQQLVQLIRDAQDVPQNLFTVKEAHQDVHAVPADDIKVRLLQPPEAFDDKGNPKKYTAQELKELKGPDNLPGYTGTLDDVKANQLVLVTLARKVGKPAKPADKPAKDADKDKEREKDNPLLVRMLVVLGEKK
jgi:hypothetical protein